MDINVCSNTHCLKFGLILCDALHPSPNQYVLPPLSRDSDHHSSLLYLEAPQPAVWTTALSCFGPHVKTWNSSIMSLLPGSHLHQIWHHISSVFIQTSTSVFFFFFTYKRSHCAPPYLSDPYILSQTLRSSDAGLLSIPHTRL